MLDNIKLFVFSMDKPFHKWPEHSLYLGMDAADPLNMFIHADTSALSTQDGAFSVPHWNRVGINVTLLPHKKVSQVAAYHAIVTMLAERFKTDDETVKKCEQAMKEATVRSMVTKRVLTLLRDQDTFDETH